MNCHGCCAAAAFPSIAVDERDSPLVTLNALKPWLDKHYWCHSLAEEYAIRLLRAPQEGRPNQKRRCQKGICVHPGFISRLQTSRSSHEVRRMDAADGHDGVLARIKCISCRLPGM